MTPDQLGIRLEQSTDTHAQSSWSSDVRPTLGSRATLSTSRILELVAILWAFGIPSRSVDNTRTRTRTSLLRARVRHLVPFEMAAAEASHSAFGTVAAGFGSCASRASPTQKVA